jgi:hypothetical protein
MSVNLFFVKIFLKTQWNYKKVSVRVIHSFFKKCIVLNFIVRDN